MNKVSIVINGVRYDAVDESAYCVGCDLIDMCKVFSRSPIKSLRNEKENRMGYD